jgi:hypothetical protein
VPKLSDLATTFRSKNAEPFLTTMDIYFPDEFTYSRVKDSGVLDEAAVLAAYKVPEQAFYGIYWVDDLCAVKVTLLKYDGKSGEYLGQGDPELSDMFGAQYHVPLLDLEVP